MSELTDTKILQQVRALLNQQKNPDPVVVHYPPMSGLAETGFRVVVRYPLMSGLTETEILQQVRALVNQQKDPFTPEVQKMLADSTPSIQIGSFFFIKNSPAPSLYPIWNNWSAYDSILRKPAFVTDDVEKMLAANDNVNYIIEGRFFTKKGLCPAPETWNGWSIYSSMYEAGFVNVYQTAKEFWDCGMEVVDQFGLHPIAISSSLTDKAVAHRATHLGHSFQGFVIIDRPLDPFCVANQENWIFYMPKVNDFAASTPEERHWLHHKLTTIGLKFKTLKGHITVIHYDTPPFRNQFSNEDGLVTAAYLLGNLEMSSSLISLINWRTFLQHE